MVTDYSSGDAAVAGLLGLLGGVLVFLVIIGIALAVLIIVACVKIFKKAGKPGWAAIIPYYNTWVLCEIAGLKWYFFVACLATSVFEILGLKILLPLAALISLAATFCVNYNLCKKFDKDPIGFAIGMTLLPVVFYPILAFGDAQYKDVKVSTYGPIPEDKIEKNGSTTSNKGEPQGKFCKNCGAAVSDEKFCPSCGTEIH